MRSNGRRIDHHSITDRSLQEEMIRKSGDSHEQRNAEFREDNLQSLNLDYCEPDHEGMRVIPPKCGISVGVFECLRKNWKMEKRLRHVERKSLPAVGSKGGVFSSGISGKGR